MHRLEKKPVRATCVGLQSRWRITARAERVPADEEAFSAHTYFMTNPSLSGRGKALRRAHPRLVVR